MMDLTHAHPIPHKGARPPPSAVDRPHPKPPDRPNPPELCNNPNNH